MNGLHLIKLCLFSCKLSVSGFLHPFQQSLYKILVVSGKHVRTCMYAWIKLSVGKHFPDPEGKLQHKLVKVMVAQFLAIFTVAVLISICVSVFPSVCVSVYTITQKNNGSIHLKLEHIAV